MTKAKNDGINKKIVTVHVSRLETTLTSFRIISEHLWL